MFTSPSKEKTKGKAILFSIDINLNILYLISSFSPLEIFYILQISEKIKVCVSFET